MSDDVIERMAEAYIRGAQAGPREGAKAAARVLLEEMRHHPEYWGDPKLYAHYVLDIDLSEPEPSQNNDTAETEPRPETD